MKKQQTDKPIDEELLMRMMAGETEKPQGNGDAPETEEEAEEPNRKQKRGNCRANGKQGCREGG